MAKVTKKKSRKTRSHRIISVRTKDLMARLHSVSVDGPLVIDFGDPSLREAFRLWWHPYDMGPDFDELTGQDQQVIRVRRTARGGHGTIKHVPAAHPVMRGDSIERRKLDPAYYRRINRALNRIFPMKVSSKKTGRKHVIKRREQPSARPAPVKVLIRLNYPLTENQKKVVTIDRRYPGEIFALTHDFYREIYERDERGGGRPGPMNGGDGPILNRGRGPLVWGHDLGDLAFESCQYRKFSPAKAKKLGAEGEFTFGIGS